MSDAASDFADPSLARELIEVLPRWKRDALAYRESLGARAALDLPYGPRARQRVDIFPASDGSDGPVAMFLHGGYWQSMHRLSFSHLARGANAHGVTVAVGGYTLCPEASVEAIVREVREAVSFVARRFKRPVTVYGHSAGGHLAACLVATDWRTVATDLDAVTVPAALCVSGIYDLDALVRTPLNEKLRLDADSAAGVSPLRWPLPSGRRVVAWVGEREPQEFHWQAERMVARFTAAGTDARQVVGVGCSHFTVLAPLADPASAITHDLVALARGAGVP